MDQPQPPPDFLAPNSRAYIGRYRLVARLGSGGMADVYLAMASGMVGFTKFSVIKVLKPENAHDPEHVTMFLDEARLAAKLNHPNVVQTNEVGEDQGLYYLVMEYLEGQTLRRVLQLGRDDHERRYLPLFLHVISDMLAGLHHAHELCDYNGQHLGVVHRDVSPHNVFVTYEGQAKVVDFGIAKVIGAEHMTRTGMLKGKIAYMAPEQARARNVDRRADLFSTGVILWETLTRKRMWEGEADFGVLQKLAVGEIQSVREHAPGLPEELYRICERSLAVDPNARFSTAQEMREALELFMNTQNWRVTSSEIGALMTGRFSGERGAIRSLVESAVAAGTGSHSGLPWLLNTNTGSEHSGDASLRPSLSNQMSQLSQLSQMSQLSSPGRFPSADSASLAGNFHLSTGATRPRSRMRSAARWLAPALLSALFSGGAGFWVLRRRHEAVVPPTSSSATVVAAPPPSESAAPPVSIELSVRVTPAEATIYLDDKPLKGNPFHGVFPREGKHELRVEAPGYQSVKQTLSFQRDVSLELSLVRHTTPPPRVVVAPPPPVRPRTPPTKPPGAQTEPAFELPTPATKRPVQPIDADSPY